MNGLILLIAVTVLNHVTFGAARVITSIYALSLGASSLVVGALIALFAVLPMLFSVAVGRLSDRIGARQPMLIGTASIIVGTLLPYLLPGLPTLFVSSVLIGSGFMLYQVVVQHTVGFFGKPEDRAVNFSFYAIGMAMSGFCGPMIAGFGIDTIGHLRTFLLVSGLPVVTFVAIAAGKVRLPQVPHHAETPGGRNVLDLLRSMRLVFIVTGLLSMAWDLYMFVMPIYGTSIGLSASRIGLVMGSFSAATFVIRLALPRMVRRYSNWQMLAFALFVASGAFAVFPLVSSFALLACASFVLGLGLGSSQPNVMSLLHNAAPPGRSGEAVGVRSTLVNFSQTSLPLFFGAVGAVIGMGPIFWIMAATLAWGGWSARREQLASESAKRS